MVRVKHAWRGGPSTHQGKPDDARMNHLLFWSRFLAIVSGLALAWGGVAYLGQGAHGIPLAEAAQCAEANRAALDDALRLGSMQNLPEVMAALGRISPCPVLSLRAWTLLVLGLAGLVVAMLFELVDRRINRLAAGIEIRTASAPGTPRAFVTGAPVSIAAAIQAAPPPKDTPPLLPEDHPMVRQVVEEMRGQGLNISVEVAQLVAALRLPRAEAARKVDA